MIEVEPDRDPATPKPAATVLLLRDRPAGGFDVFMVRRHARSGFMGGAYVFPGGKLDPEDSAEALEPHLAGRSAAEAAAALGEPDARAVARGLFVAALRETFEEAGVLLADLADAGVPREEARHVLQSGGSLLDVLPGLGARLRLDQIVPWARWVTPTVERRRFDARFFVAVAPDDQEPAHDRRETTEAAWLTPDEALAREAAGEILLPPPTLRSLEILREAGTAAEVLAGARAVAPPFVDPVFREVGDTWILALPGDPEHPTPTRAVPGATRFVLRNGRWHSAEAER